MTTNGILDMLNRAPYGAYAVDMSQVIVFWNRLAERIVGFKAGDAIGRRCYEVLQSLPEQGTVPVCMEGCPAIRLAREGRVPPVIQVRMRCASGRRKRDVDFSILETIGVIADPLGLIRMRILREKIDEIQESDHQVSEVLMIDPPKDVEMLTGIYKFCVLGAAACAVSPQYAGDNDGRTVIQSADVLINWDRISRVPDTPNTASIQFNACPSGKNSAYRTLLHEAGHALGLSDAAVPENAKQIFNDFRSKIHQFIKRFFDATVLGILNRIIENTVGELPERTYETSHPSIADSVMNYDYEVQQNLDNNGAWVRNEPDCWPHPFDIMAINSIYQADYP